MELLLINNYILQSASGHSVRNNIFVLYFSQEGDLADGGAGQSFIFDFNENFFDGYILIALEIKSFVDKTIGSFPYMIK